jgi:hypothetical protein
MLIRNTYKFLKTLCIATVLLAALPAHAASGGLSLSPLSVTVGAAQTVQFAASGAGSSSISWNVNGIIGGNDTVGRITASGFYTAPAAPPSPATVTIGAVSLAVTSKSAQASVKITDGVTVSVSPTSASVQVAQTHQFSATVIGASNTAVSWSVNGING